MEDSASKIFVVTFRADAGAVKSSRFDLLQWYEDDAIDLLERGVLQDGRKFAGQPTVRLIPMADTSDGRVPAMADEEIVEWVIRAEVEAISR